MSVRFNRQAAVNYAHQYCMTPNLIKYPNFGDEDCTNFVSQCWKEAGIPTTTEWHCYSANDATTAWISVPDFANYMHNKGYCSISYDTEAVQLGDIVQLYNDTSGWHHSAIITKIENGYLGKKLYYSAHSNARYDEPLSNVTENIRFLCVYAF